MSIVERTDPIPGRMSEPTPDAIIGSFSIGGGVDLVATLGPYRVTRSDPAMLLAPGEVWRATRTPDGPATLHVVASRPDPPDLPDPPDPLQRSTDFVATGWGPGAAWAVDHAPELLGVDDDLGTFAMMASTQRLVHDAHRRHPGARVGRSRAVTEALVPTILEQKVTSIEAHRSYRALVRAFGEPAPGPAGDRGLRLRPDPARLARLAYSDLHRFGIERRRAETILRVCRRAGLLDALALGAADDLDPARARAVIEAFPGLGPWTSAIVTQLAFGDADVVIVGDYHLPHLVSWNLAGEPRGTDARMVELLEPFRGHRGRVVRLLGAEGSHAPRRGPKRRLRSIASM